MNNADIPMLIKRCLAHGLAIYPHELSSVLRKYGQYKIPDDHLSALKKDDLSTYVRGLYLSDQESAGDWTRGHDFLKSLGFTQSERRDGHRTYISMVFLGDEAEQETTGN